MAADDHAEIATLKKRLAELDAERKGLLALLEQLQQRNNAEAKRSSSQISNAEKVTLFRSFFRGRDDVFHLEQNDYYLGSLQSGNAIPAKPELLRLLRN